MKSKKSDHIEPTVRGMPPRVCIRPFSLIFLGQRTSLGVRHALDLKRDALRRRRVFSASRPFRSRRKASPSFMI